MSYNKDENASFQNNQDTNAQTPAQRVTPDSPASYGIHRFDSHGTPNSSAFGSATNPAPNIWEAYKMFWQNYVNFSGRSRRSEFWWPTLINTIIGAVFYGIMVGSLDVPIDQIAQMEPEEVAEMLMKGGGYWTGSLLLSLFGLATLIPTISLAVRRLHDLNVSGWWYLTMLLNCCCGIVAIVFLIYFAQDSKPGTNEWGVSPKYRQVPE